MFQVVFLVEFIMSDLKKVFFVLEVSRTLYSSNESGCEAAADHLDTAPISNRIAVLLGATSAECIMRVNSNLSPAEACIVLEIPKGEDFENKKRKVKKAASFLEEPSILGFLKKRLSKSETGGDPNSIKISIIIK